MVVNNAYRFTLMCLPGGHCIASTATCNSTDQVWITVHTLLYTCYTPSLDYCTHIATCYTPSLDYCTHIATCVIVL